MPQHYRQNPGPLPLSPQLPGVQGLPPGIDPRAMAANPQGFAPQQAQLQQAGPGGQQGGLAALLSLLSGRKGGLSRAVPGRRRRRRPRKARAQGANAGPLGLLSLLGGG